MERIAGTANSLIRHNGRGNRKGLAAELSPNCSRGGYAVCTFASIQGAVWRAGR